MIYNLEDIDLIPARLSEVEYSNCNIQHKENHTYPFYLKSYSDTVPNNISNIAEIIVSNKFLHIKNRIQDSLLHYCEFDIEEFKDLDLECLQNHKIYFSKYTNSKKLFLLCKKLKESNNNIKIIVGNIQSIDTYTEYAKIGVDNIIIGSTNDGLTDNLFLSTSASLIKDFVEVKWYIQKSIEDCQKINIVSGYKSVPNIVVDLSFTNNYLNIIKCLVLGADYVLINKNISINYLIHLLKTTMMYCNCNNLTELQYVKYKIRNI